MKLNYNLTSFIDMKKAVLPILAALAVVSISCSQEENADFEKQYIDLKSVIEAAVIQNEAENPSFNKEVWINEETETITTQKLDWDRELEVFHLADLNKRDYLNKYAKDSTAYQVKYSLLPEMEAPVKELIVKFDTNSAVSAIKAVLLTDNFLYESERELDLKFTNSRLVQYEVDGWQELFIGSKKTYRLKSTKKGG